jgi:hypothetical protein
MIHGAPNFLLAASGSLSYWHLFKERPTRPEPRFDGKNGRREASCFLVPCFLRRLTVSVMNGFD